MYKLGILTTLIVTTLNVYSLISTKELYPFAPYVMYSVAHLPGKLTMIELYFEDSGGNLIKVKDKDIAPYDESRAKNIFIELYWDSEQLTAEQVDNKASRALETIYNAYLKNRTNLNTNYSNLVLYFERWGSVEAIQKGIPEYKEEKLRFEKSKK